MNRAKICSSANPAQQRISGRHIAAWLGPRERSAILACAAVAFCVALFRHGWAEAGTSALLGAITAAITLIDLRHFRIPDLLSLPLIPLGLLAVHLAQAPLIPHLLALMAVWGLLKLLQWAFLALRGRSGLGSGDVKLMAAAAVWLDPSVLPTFVLAAAGTALLEGWLRRVGLQGRIAFGAHLAPWLAVFVMAA